ncbi:protein ERGIC-53 [Culicoides brevitarsis]|uniref:protein ERGIC-53 n=1 Tax=Culicoides brevitarsis TaxID=469753 RepID=UPI00307C0DE7
MLIRSALALKIGLLCVLLFVHTSEPSNNLVHRQFRYKYSFKPPFLAQKDGSVPFWTYGGNAIASGEMVRLAPSLKSQKGAIWTKTRTEFEWWEVDIVFRISGRGRIGADGMAFWYTTEQGDYHGNSFGSSDTWNGLGVIFDSFDNDNGHNNPYISAVVNDGTQTFDHQNDGKAQLLSGCLKDFRNKPFPTRARIEYYQNVLTVMFNNGMTQNEQDYEMCLRVENVHLPKFGYFGLSAATGGLADDHDVYHFLTTSLHPAQMNVDTQTEDPKLTQEYQEYQKKLEQQKEDYRKEHPEEKDDFDDWFETDNQREYRQLWQAQTTTNDMLRELSRKLDEVLGKQERTLGLVSASAGQGQIQHHQGQQQQQFQQPPSGGYTVTRQDIDVLISNQQAVSSTVSQISALIGDLQQKTNNLLSKGTATVQAGGSYQDGPFINEMRDGINHLKVQLSTIGQQAMNAQAQRGGGGGGGCPDQSCLSLKTFLIVIVVQLLITLGYNIYRDNKESQAKKFY